MLSFEGTHDFKRPPEEVWCKLRDAGFLVQCIPGVEGVACQDRDRAACKIRPQFAFVHGSLDVTIQASDIRIGTSALITILSKGIGATSEIEAKFSLAVQETGTRLNWSAEIKQLGGLLKAIPQGLVKASAQNVIEEMLTNVEAKLLNDHG